MTNRPGFVTQITHDDLDRLSPPLRSILQEELTNVRPEEPHQCLREDVTPEQIREVMAFFEVDPVFAQDGSLVYSLSVDGKILVFRVVPDMEKDSIPIDMLTRKWVECESLPDLMDRLTEHITLATDSGQERPHIVPEDHPEDMAIGFRSVEANTVWLLDARTLEQDLEAGNTWGLVNLHSLMSSTLGRAELAKRLTEGTFVTPGMLKPQEPSMQRRTSEIFVDLMSGQLSRAYQKRYLPKKDPNV